MAKAKLFRHLGSFIKGLLKEPLAFTRKKYQILESDFFFFFCDNSTSETNPTVFLVNLNESS